MKLFTNCNINLNRDSMLQSGSVVEIRYTYRVHSLRPLPLIRLKVESNQLRHGQIILWFMLDGRVNNKLPSTLGKHEQINSS